MGLAALSRGESSGAATSSPGPTPSGRVFCFIYYVINLLTVKLYFFFLLLCPCMVLFLLFNYHFPFVCAVLPCVYTCDYVCACVLVLLLESASRVRSPALPSGWISVLGATAAVPPYSLVPSDSGCGGAWYAAYCYG